MLRFAEPLSSGRLPSMDDTVTIHVASQFSETPFGRYRSDGPESGQVFRDDFLLPYLRAGKRIVIDIDGVAGLPSSFWEESLGGAVRAGIPAAIMRNLVTIEANQSDLKTYVRIGWKYVDEAEKMRLRRPQ